MTTAHRQQKEIEEMLVQEFSILSNMAACFTTGPSPEVTKNAVQGELPQRKSGKPDNLVAMYIQPKDQHDHPQAKGICSNCLNFKHCQLPKDPAGVWHCEEYL
jgi:hypothetical protein